MPTIHTFRLLRSEAWQTPSLCGLLTEQGTVLLRYIGGFSTALVVHPARKAYGQLLLCQS